MKEEALDAFRRSVEAGYSQRRLVRQDPDLNILHDDPEFKRLVGSEPGQPASKTVAGCPTATAA